MRYAVCGGWFLEQKHFDKVDRLLCEIFRRYGFPTALICGHMPGAEKLTVQWGQTMLVREVKVVDLVMPNERAAAFHDHNPQMLLRFTSGSPANDVLATFLTNRGVPLIEVPV